MNEMWMMTIDSIRKCRLNGKKVANIGGEWITIEHYTYESLRLLEKLLDELDKKIIAAFMEMEQNYERIEQLFNIMFDVLDETHLRKMISALKEQLDRMPGVCQEEIGIMCGIKIEWHIRLFPEKRQQLELAQKLLGFDL